MMHACGAGNSYFLLSSCFKCFAEVDYLVGATLKFRPWRGLSEVNSQLIIYVYVEICLKMLFVNLSIDLAAELQLQARHESQWYKIKSGSEPKLARMHSSINVRGATQVCWMRSFTPPA